MSDEGDHGGILFPDSGEDISEICRIFEIGIGEWNSKWAAKEGVVLGIRDNAVEVTSTLGGKILFVSLPKPPDAFKRVAAMLVMMALHPFITGRASDKEKGLYVRVLQGDDLRPFAIRFVVDSLPIIFSLLDQQVTIGEKSIWLRLDKWRGFPNEEIRDELISLLYSISKSDVIMWEGSELRYHQDRLARGILAVSLTLKATYGEIKP